MDWLMEAQIRLKRGNQLLFAKDSEYLQDLTVLLQRSSHRAVALWAFDFAAQSVARLEARYPDERRPRQALEAAQDWAAGRLKMRIAQRRILDCHAFAKQTGCKEDAAACHAVGQACAVVHTAGHAIGYPIYDLTSVIYRLGIENCAGAIGLRKQAYLQRLFYWNEHLCDDNGGWADFMLR